jgi:Tol biopolymer transport system component/predicted Ser/Thr protein kinase
MQPGERISHYEILSPLGAGGMGQVWLARDTQLERNVAVKVIHPRLAGNPEWMGRFVQEARAAAALNHPNIAQIHELCEAGETPMIVMEFVEGRTLKERIHEGVLRLETILDIGIQAASALEEAHAKGVIHRDIKPGNIMLSSRGVVKVLDFGVAKVLEEPRMEATTAAASSDETATHGGEICGTLRYMSREQCVGGSVDRQSDVFSLGAVLYEMATGKHAFPGSTPALIYDAILNRTPVAPSRLNKEIPGEFDRIVAKTLEKQVHQRYASAAELEQDLERLRRSVRGEESHQRAGAGWKSYVVIAVILLLAAAVAFFTLRRAGETVSLRVDPLTSAQGTESQPSFSPDGNQIAYAWNGDAEENWDIYVKLIRGGPSLRLTESPAVEYSPAWSPDGTSIAFLRHSETEGSGFYLIPALGGAEKKLTTASPSRTGVESPFLAWSPDGKMLAIADKKAPGEPMCIELLDLATGSRKTLTRPPANTFGDSGIVYAPDGNRIFFVRSNGMGIQDIYSVDVGGGEPNRLTFDNRRVYGLAWNYADRRLLFASARKDGARLWRLSPSGGEPQRVVGIGETASFLAISRRNHRLAYTQSNMDTNIWSYDLKGGRPPRRLISSTRLEQGPQFSPDGTRIAFASTRTGAWEVFLCDPNGDNTLQLTSFADRPGGSPQWAPDGESIAFDARPGGNADIFTLRLAGGAPVRLTTHTAQDAVPSYSRDGRFIYFGSNRTGRFEIWKMPVSGGEPEQITRNGGFYASESPDGKFLYYARALDQPGLYRMPLQGGAESVVIENLRAGYWGYRVITQRGIYYVDREGTGQTGLRHLLKFIDLTTMRHEVVLQLGQRPFNAGLSLSPDGSQVLYTQADRADTDIMLAEGFR